ncbi:MAG: secretin [Bradyrhizobiaceae bacterium]|nr:MAG: secretin [Bradyrhizobiaceae bacterium]
MRERGLVMGWNARWRRWGGWAALAAAAVLAAGTLDAPQAQDRSAAAGRTSFVRISIGKSETARTGASFADVVVADPEVADAVPLTDRSLSILGKKIGTTRVSVYAEGKTLVGVFDVEVSYDTSRLASELAQRFPRAHFRVSSVNGRIMLSGTSPDAVTLDLAMTMAKQFGGDVINSVRVTQPQQVMLEVRFIEATRTAGRELGINWDIMARNFQTVTGIAGMVAGTEPFGTIVGTLLGRGIQAEVIIRALEERGLARRLAEPNLVALSGDTASFLAGGEFPIPVSSNLGTVTVEFKKFGVGLAFTPTVLEDGLINLKIEPEVSQLDPTTTITVGGITVPSLIVRRAATTVELRDGQSFAIAGLLQSISTTDQRQFPWLADVPVIGALLRSAAYQKKETDLAIIVTPRLVRPLRPGEHARTPFDNALPANDPDYFLLGQSELPPSKVRAIAGQPRPQVGHILDVRKGGVHAAH